ncbi:unnamed protein product [Musa hybrid cultivar]
MINWWQNANEQIMQAIIANEVILEGLSLSIIIMLYGTYSSSEGQWHHLLDLNTGFQSSEY